VRVHLGGGLRGEGDLRILNGSKTTKKSIQAGTNLSPVGGGHPHGLHVGIPVASGEGQYSQKRDALPLLG